MQKIKEFIRKTLYRIVPPPYVKATYSQVGEDVIVQFLFNDYGIKKISYLDVGTNSPIGSNNTYLFYKNGSSGVCVEADTSLIESIKTARPNDKVINAGVAVSDEKEADFYIFDIPAINTFDKKEAENRTNSGTYKIVKVVKVPLININDLIKNNFSSCPDFLSIDIEGLDLDVLKSLNYDEHPIPVICVETCTYSEMHVRPKDVSINEFMATIGYEIYADTYVNTIFINKKWFYKK